MMNFIICDIHGQFEEVRNSDVPIYEIEKYCKDSSYGRYFCQLYDYGNWLCLGLKSKREADLCLCKMIALWTEDVDKIYRLFYTSALRKGEWGQSKGYRNKIMDETLKEISQIIKKPNWKY